MNKAANHSHGAPILGEADHNISALGMATDWTDEGTALVPIARLTSMNLSTGVIGPLSCPGWIVVSAI